MELLQGSPWLEWNGVIISFLSLSIALTAGVVLYEAMSFIASRLSRRIGGSWSPVFLNRLRGPIRILFPLLTIMVTVPSLGAPPRIAGLLQHLLGIGLIAVTAWLFSRFALAGRDIVLMRYDVDLRDNLKARAIHTQLTVLVRIVLVIIVIVAGASILMTFEKIRQVGMSILASAGIVGVILGFAAQRSLAALLAGLQIALTQPIRLDDVVVVEGEWGVIEEITLTYVVIKIWDLRRLVVPVTFFLEKPFQNWTRTTANLLGTVLIHTDYTVPVDEVRRALYGILDASDKWDRQAWGLQVTNSSGHTMELRALMSAADGPTVWDLRCEVREKILAFIRDTYPESFPRVRAELDQGASPAAPLGSSG